MVAPLMIPLGAIILAGGAAAIKGTTDIVKAHSILKLAKAAHSQALTALESAQAPVHRLLTEYGLQQLKSIDETIGQFAHWIEQNEMAVKRLDQELVDGFEVTVPELPELKNEITLARNWLKGGVAGASATAIAPQAALLGVSTFATAGTGTAISSLTGAAATNATLAWLGGGTLAAGGGGMAAGSVVLTLVATAPAAFIGGLTVAVIGSKQKTNAKQYLADVTVAISEIESAIQLLPSISHRVNELSGILKDLDSRAQIAINELIVLDFDPDLHASEFLRSLQLTRAIREVVNTPILDAETGHLTEVSFNIVRKYQ